MNEVATRPPLEPWDGKPVLPWKTNTRLRRTLFDVSEIVPILLQMEALFGEDDVDVMFGHWPWKGGRYIQLTPRDDAHARAIVGKLIRLFRAKPTIKKVGDDALESHWWVPCSDMEVAVTVKGYKPKTCRYEEVEVDVPAQEARTETVVHEAIPAYKTTKRVLVCDEAPEAEDATVPAEEIPF